MTSDQPFVTILSDPPWQYDQPLKMADGVKRSSSDQYPTLSVQQICDLYTPSRMNGPRARVQPGTLAGHLIADTALLGLWITAPFLLEGVHNRVCEAWGFTPRQIVPWIKGRLTIIRDPTVMNGLAPKFVIQPGMGALTRGCVEYLILATRGKYTKLVQNHATNGLLLAEEDAWIVAPKSKHSRKPDQQYSLLGNLFPGPRLELFATQPREGWTSWGLSLPPMTAVNEPALPLEPSAPITEWPEPYHTLEVVDDQIVKDVGQGVRPEPPVSWE